MTRANENKERNALFMENLLREAGWVRRSEADAENARMRGALEGAADYLESIDGQIYCGSYTDAARPSHMASTLRKALEPST